MCNKTNITRKAVGILTSLFAGLVYIAIASGAAVAKTQRYCVVCKDPNQTYVCQVDTPHANPSDKGLQLYCIIRISKDGSHNSCAVQSNSADACDGPIKAYAFQAPAISPQLRDSRPAAQVARERRRRANSTAPKGRRAGNLDRHDGKGRKSIAQGLVKYRTSRWERCEFDNWESRQGRAGCRQGRHQSRWQSRFGNQKDGQRGRKRREDCL